MTNRRLVVLAYPHRKLERRAAQPIDTAARLPNRKAGYHRRTAVFHVTEPIDVVHMEPKSSNVDPAYCRAFHLFCQLDDFKRERNRIAAACQQTTGTERESNLRQLSALVSEINRIEAELNVNENRAEVTDIRKPESRHRSQEQRILTALRALGHDPLALPRQISGKKWLKTECREKIGREMTDSVFKHAWDRLRASQDIREI